MSSQKPGRNRVKAINKSATLSQALLLVNNQPCVAAANSIIAITAMMNTNTALPSVTSISYNSVLKMKRNGNKAVRMS